MTEKLGNVTFATDRKDSHYWVAVAMVPHLPNRMTLRFRQALNLPVDVITVEIDEMTPHQLMRSMRRAEAQVETQAQSQPQEEETDATQFFPSPPLPSPPSPNPDLVDMLLDNCCRQEMKSPGKKRLITRGVPPTRKQQRQRGYLVI